VKKNFAPLSVCRTPRCGKDKIAGVQAQLYDAYGYLKEKRQALDTLLDVLERKPAKNVRPLTRSNMCSLPSDGAWSEISVTCPLRRPVSMAPSAQRESSPGAR
jgi:hypothetical protein